MHTRFENRGEEIYDFMDEFVVACPRCRRVAVVKTHREEGAVWHQSKAKLVCSHCAYVQTRRLRGWNDRMPVDWFFHQPLWLQKTCCGETLWAFNLAHLNYIERYVRADLRDEGFHHNRALANRLPRWMKLAKHRDEVLKGIERLKKRALGG